MGVMHKIVVVGRGLIGSAAARHLAESGDGIACVGPDEPTSRAAHSGVFASHYDEGRMTRHVDPEREWSITARHAIARYRDLETRSGVPFYIPSGYLGLGLGSAGKTYNAQCAATGEAEGAAVERLDAAGVRARFPFLAIPDDADGLVETGGAGHISPRRMVHAQTRLAEMAGARIIRQAARAIRSVRGGVEVELWDGSTVTAEKALVAAGAFTTCCGLSPEELDLTVYGRTIVLVRIEGEAADVLRSMPTMIDTAIGAYLLPPIVYLDGHAYLKIGVGTEDDPRFTSLGALQSWFKSAGSEGDRDKFTAHLKSRFPVLNHCAHWHTDTCAVTRTASGLPIIDFVQPGKIAVAVGGCGKGAKGSDEWGRIAADVVRESPWSSEVAREKLAFRARRRAV
ncbi:MAG: FAD-binding oxidoreductase [Pseudomonadota bacterium]